MITGPFPLGMNERLGFISHISVLRDCLVTNDGNTSWCRSNVWEDNWTLVAQNTLGTVRLTDSAQLADRGTTFQYVLLLIEYINIINRVRATVS